MANTYVDYTAVASQTDYNFSFEYLRDEHVKVKVNDVITTNYTIVTSPVQLIRFNTAPTAGAAIKIYRDSRGDFSPLVDFVDGSVLTENELDESYKHNLFVSQESSEGTGGEQLTKKGLTNYDAEGNKIINLGTPTAATDAANKAYTDQTVDAAIALGGSPAIVSLGGYDVTALGTTRARSLADRFSDVVNVLDYGAYNDGSNGTATTAAFNNALLAANGKALKIPPGTYLIESTLDISSGNANKPKIIFGGGSLRYNGTGACILLNGSVGAFQRLTIENITLGRASTNSNTNLIGLWFNGGTIETSRVNLYNVLITQYNTAGSIGLKLNRTWLNSFVGCEFFENYIGVNLNTTANNNSFFGCKINAQSSHGVLIDSDAVSALFSGCEIEANTGSGIKVTSSCIGLTADTCYFEANDEYDVHLNGSNIVSTHLTNNFHFHSAGALGTIYGEAHSDLVVSGYFSANATETTPGFVTTASGTNITTNNIHINGWNNGDNFYSIDSDSKRASIDNGTVTSNTRISAPVLGANPSNADLAAALSVSTGTVSDQTNCNIKIVTKSQEITHTTGSATNTDFKIVASTDPGWASCYIMYTFNNKQGQPANYYSANWSLGGHSTSGTAWTSTYSSLLDEHFATGGGHTASAVNVGSDLCFRHTITSPISSTVAVGTMTAIFLYSTV
jgi:hypothetical protein